MKLCKLFPRSLTICKTSNNAWREKPSQVRGERVKGENLASGELGSTHWAKMVRTLYFPRKNGHVILGFLVRYRRNRVTLSPEPPGIFRFGLAPAGTGPGPVGCP